MNDPIPVSLATRRFNAMVERFDMLTLYTKDQDTAHDIYRWFWAHDPVIADIFTKSMWAMGYLKLSNTTHTETVKETQLYGI